MRFEHPVHAKITLSDDEAVFTTCANFTGHALERNLEAGVMIKGGDTPQDIYRHWKGLMELKTISKVG
ncbi:phospholipase D-like domain-containing protein [Aestuariicoccus sp. MJ-SS9]|uniref:phospholipase D-like domain-containing protein n=1 Tax=Aestuariicoccus sp. MJ-SS9 TaxID=3079855 RepID=UPI003977308B